MIRGMADWNVSSDSLTVEPRQRRSPSRWLHQNSLRIAVVLGLVEAVWAWAAGYRLLMTLIGVLAVGGSLQVRQRMPERIRRPVWVIVMAQAIAGLVLPLVIFGMAMFAIVAGLILVVLVLVMLGDLMRR